MRTFWLTYSNGYQCCVEADSPEAAKLIAAGTVGDKECVRVETLPYPAHPRVGPRSEWPTFCSRPNQCVGRGSCPHDPACTE